MFCVIGGVAARLLAEGTWRGTGVMSPEQFEPDPFLEAMSRAGMPWQVRDDTVRVGTPRVVTRSSRETVAA